MNEETKNDTLANFGKEFQTKAISAILADRAFLERIYDILSPDFFEQDAQKWIIKQSTEYFIQYKNLISLTVFGAETNKLSDDVLKAAIQEQLKKSYKEVTSGDLQYIKNEFLEFCKHQKIKSAISDSIDLLKNKQFDAIKTKFDDALKAGIDRDIGSDYFTDLDARYKDDIRNVVKTNLPLLDELLDGGLGRGELGFFVGTAGSMKSWQIQRLGAEAILQGKNVIHFTMELKAAYTEFRYDSYLTQIPFNIIKDNKPRVQDTLAKLRTNGAGTLIVKYFPMKTISAETLKAHTEQVQIITGKKMDLMIVDYADLLRPAVIHKNSNSYSEGGAVYEELRSIAGILDIPIWTASQANRSALQNDIVEGDDVAESYKKIMTGDFVASMARTTENVNTKTARIHIIKNRFGSDRITYLCNADAATGKIEMFETNSIEGLEILKKIKGQEEVTKDVIRKKWNQNKDRE